MSLRLLPMALRTIPALLLFLTGCMPSKPLDVQATSTMHRIALIQPHGPEAYLVGSNGETPTLVTTPTLATDVFFMTQHSIQANNSTNRQFRTDMSAAHVDLASELGQSVEQALKAEGYDVVVVTLPAATTDDLARDVSSLKGKADAALELAIASAGYAYTTGHPYEPRVDVKARLTDLTTNTVLYENSFSYMRRWNPQHYNIVLDPAQGYNFRGGGDLLKEPARAAAGLRSAIPSLTQQIANDLKRPTP